MPLSLPSGYITEVVATALAEDIGSGDVTAELIAPECWARGEIRVWQGAILCGRAFASECFSQVDERIGQVWEVDDGDRMDAEARVATVRGPARSLLSVERTALNFLQTLSGTATRAASWAKLVAGTGVQLLDTRKTIPGLRRAQKYAVHAGGGHNHRQGLFDAYLIKENHIRTCGSIVAAVAEARRLRADMPVEVEVEDMEQLDEALRAGAERVLLDNFTPAQVRRAVVHVDGRAVLEASGGIDEDNLLEFANTKVDCISLGALTKHIQAVDLSMEIYIDADSGA